MSPMPETPGRGGIPTLGRNPWRRQRKHVRQRDRTPVVRHEERVVFQDDPHAGRAGVVGVLDDFGKALQPVARESLRASACTLDDGLHPAVRRGEAHAKPLDRGSRGRAVPRLEARVALGMLQ